MMLFLFFIVSVLCMIVGHIFKVKRWKQLIAVYEEADEYPLMTAMAWGHIINTVCPIRIGYIFRMFWAGRRLKTGHVISVATTVADLYVDAIVVSIIASVALLFSRGNDNLAAMAVNYRVVLFFLIAGTILAVIFKRYIKYGVKKMASVFNEKIEYYILYLVYLSIASVKDIVKKIKVRFYLLYTVLMWSGYILSYIFIAKVICGIGYTYTTSDVFTILFSGTALVFMDRQLMLIFIGYLCIPLFLCLIIYYIVHRLAPVKTADYRRPLPQINYIDKLLFLKEYYEDENRDIIYSYLEINQDVAIVEDRSAGSNACTSVVMNKEGKMFFRKYAYNKDGEKLLEQVDWIEKHQEFIPLPLISRKKYKDSYATYDMPYYSSAIGFFKYIHTVPVSYSWKLLQTALDDIKSGCHSKNVRLADDDTIFRYIDSKVFGNLKIIRENDKYIRNLEEFDSLVVNGEVLPTLDFYREMLQRSHLYEVFKNDSYSDIHGDLTIENIVCITDINEIEKEEYKGKRTPSKYYFIDPNTGNLHDSPLLDLGKLLQSLHGNYEFLTVVSSVTIRKNQVDYMMMRSEAYDQLYKRYKDYLFDTYEKNQVLSIYYHEIVHWLRLMPYKIRKNEKMAVVFYTELLKVLKDVWEFEHEETKVDDF